MKTFKVQIPKPCRQDWNVMSKTETGRFCSICDKTVVDFTAMSKLEIQNYFLQYKNQNTCGHFTKIQLDTPIEKPHILLQYKAHLEQIRLLPIRYLALFFIGMAIAISGCNTGTTGEIVEIKDTLPLIATGDTALKVIKTKKDSLEQKDSNCEVGKHQKPNISELPQLGKVLKIEEQQISKPDTLSQIFIDGDIEFLE